MIIKWLGLDTLTAEVETLKAKNAYLLETLDNMEAKVNELEEPDMSDYVSEDDINDRIETYCNDNDIPSKDWIESEIGDKVQEAIDDLGEGDKLIDRIIEEYENVQAVRIERAVEKAMKKTVKPKAKAKPKKK